MESVLVTGGSGKLGRVVVDRLDDGERDVRVLSRRAAPPGGSHTPGATRRWLTGDLLSGAGLPDAVAGAGVIVHCATTNGKGDIEATRNLVDAARRAGHRPHLIYVSIVGIEAIPLPYYRAKLAAEQVISDSGLPWTVLRATQFHDLLATIFRFQRWLPLTLAVGRLSFQPIAIGAVADTLTDLALADPSGRAPDIGGPEIRTMADLARAYNDAFGRRRRVVSPRLPGKIVRAFAAGANLVPDNPIGTVTFEDFLREQAPNSR